MHKADNVEHEVFECDAWYKTRKELEAYIRKEITPVNVVTLMLSTEDYWE